MNRLCASMAVCEPGEVGADTAERMRGILGDAPADPPRSDHREAVALHWCSVYQVCWPTPSFPPYPAVSHAPGRRLAAPPGGGAVGRGVPAAAASLVRRVGGALDQRGDGGRRGAGRAAALGVCGAPPRQRRLTRPSNMRTPTPRLRGPLLVVVLFFGVLRWLCATRWLGRPLGCAAMSTSTHGCGGGGGSGPRPTRWPVAQRRTQGAGNASGGSVGPRRRRDSTASARAARGR
jgi:hypothetical protein